MPTPLPPPVDDVARELLGELDAGNAAARELEFRPLPSTDVDATCAAVDGGHSVVADVGSCGVVAVRAGYTLRAPGDRYEDHVVYERVGLVKRGGHLARWRTLVEAHAWGVPLEAPKTTSGQWVRAWCEAERSLAEFDVARRALAKLRPGDLLLLDGALDGDPMQPALAASLLQTARRMGVHVVGVTKDSGLSLGGTLLFTLETEDLALRRDAPPRFFADVGAALGRAADHGTYAVRFDGRSPVYRVDVAAAEAPEAAVLAQVATLCNDVAYLGYPYPLARVHARVHYAPHESADLRRELEAIVARRRGSLFSLRLFGKGRDVLAMGE